MTVIIEVETGLGRGHFPAIMAKWNQKYKPKVGPDWGPELAQIGIEIVVISVGNTIISQGTVQSHPKH